MILVYDRDGRGLNFSDGGPTPQVYLGVSSYSTPLTGWGTNLELVHDPVNRALRVTIVGAATGSIGTDLNFEQIIRQIYDPVVNRFRVVST